MLKTQTLDRLSSATQTRTSSAVSKTLSLLDVCYPVVSHVPTVHSHGPLQKKGVSPVQCLDKIKHVKVVTQIPPKVVFKRGPEQSYRKVGSRKGGCQVVSGLLQPPFPGPQTKQQQMEANFGPISRSGSTRPGPVDSPAGKVEIHQVPGQLHSQRVHALNKTPDSHRKTSVVGTSSYEAHSVAFKMSLAHSRSVREDYVNPSVPPSTPRLAVRRGKCTERPTLTSPPTRSAAVYRRLKRRLGRTLRGLHCKRHLVSHGKSPPHKFPRTKSSPSGPERFLAFVQGPDCSCCNRQYNGGLLHKQAGCVCPGATPEE